ncbi:MAG: helix-turn-helix domain-containing protein [Planctomycetes bacterium]|nr:helix-turn-helix domain-containing protein [Planctomycetota bacterium]
MPNRFDLITQLVPASSAGTCFFLLFLYFIFIRKVRTGPGLSFAIYLLVLGIFVFLKPFQLLSINPDLQHFICNIRYLALMPFGGPMFYYTINHLNGSKSVSRKKLIILGSVFALVYLIFNDPQKNTSSYALTVSMFYGLVFFVIPGSLSLKNWLLTKKESQQGLHFSLGALLFGLALMISAGLNTFWVLYFVALPSALFCAYAVFLELKEVHNRLDHIIPLFKEELLQDIQILNKESEKIEQYLHLAGIVKSPDIFWVLKLDTKDSQQEESFEFSPEIRTLLEKEFQRLFPSGYLLFSVGNQRLALCFSTLDLEADENESLNKAEEIRSYIENHSQKTLSIGLGNVYPKLHSLRQSYKEAINAQEYASRIGSNIVAHWDDIENPSKQQRYPALERDELLLEIRQGRAEECKLIASKFSEKLLAYSLDDLGTYKQAVQEILAFAGDSAKSAGMEHDYIHQLNRTAYQDLEGLCKQSDIQKFFCETMEKFSQEVSSSPKKRENTLISKSIQYVEDHIQESISADQLARELYISPSHFRKLFRESMDCAPSQYIARKKMEKAQEMLGDTDKNITEVAMSLGYNDSNYFSTVFKKWVGLSPREYKKSLNSTTQN